MPVDIIWANRSGLMVGQAKTHGQVKTDADDGLTDEERAKFAEDFSVTVGSDLSAEDLTRLHAHNEAGLIPARRIRLA
jgi:hypothetical protein